MLFFIKDKLLSKENTKWCDVVCVSTSERFWWGVPNLNLSDPYLTRIDENCDLSLTFIVALNFIQFPPPLPGQKYSGRAMTSNHTLLRQYNYKRNLKINQGNEKERFAFENSCAFFVCQ